MSMMATFAKKDRCEFFTHDDYMGAVKAYGKTSKNTLSDLKRREWPKKSERLRVKQAAARKRMKKLVKAIAEKRGPWRPKQGRPVRQVTSPQK